MPRALHLLAAVTFGTLICAALACSGCATQQDLDSLRWEVNALQSRTQQNEARLDEKDRLMQQSLAQQADLQSLYTDLYTQLQALQGQLDEVSAGPGGADARIAALEQEIDGLRSAVKPGPKAVAPPVESRYKLGLASFKAGRYQEAIQNFSAYLKQNPDKKLIDNAYFWIGESLYALKRYEDAILQYDTVTRKYPKSEKMPESLLKQGMSFLNLGDRQTGELILKRLVKEFKDSEAAGRAQKLLREG